MKKYVLITALGLFLAACGDGSGNRAGSGDGSRGGMDSFTSFVANLIGSSPDDTEPQSIDSVELATSETSEPSKIE